MNKDEIFEIVVNICCEVITTLKNHTFTRSDRLKELGANSLDRSEIIDMSMEKLDLSIPRVEVFGAENIGELVDILYEKSSLKK